MSNKSPKKKLPKWLQKFQDEIKNSTLRDGDLYVRVSFINSDGIKKSFEELIGTPSPDNFKDLAEKAADKVKELRKTVEEIRAGTVNDFHKTKVAITVSEFFKIWLKAVSPQLGSRTVHDYESIIERHIEKRLGKVLLARLSKAHIEDLCESLLKKGVQRQARYVKQVLSTAMTYAINEKYRDGENPARGVKLPKKTHKEIVAFDKEQTKRFIEVARESENGLLFEFAVKTGMRPEEYLALRWRDIDFEQCTAQVRRTVNLTKPSLAIFEETKTKSSRRLIKFDSSLAERLKAHQLEQKAHIETFKKYKNLKYQNFHLVFPSAYGTPWALQNLSRRFYKPILEKAGLDNMDATLYSLRHTCATLLLLANVSPKIVQERLGHASITITLDTYSHVLPTMGNIASDVLENLLN